MWLHKDMGSDFMYLFILFLGGGGMGVAVLGIVLACATCVGFYVCGLGWDFERFRRFCLISIYLSLFYNWFVLHYVGRIHDARQEA